MWSILVAVDWVHVLTVIAAFLVGIIVKTLLDLRLALFLIKYFWWVRPRWVFGENPHELSGTWKHIWESGGSEKYASADDRSDHTTFRQLGHYCYADFIYQGRRYYFFGKVHADYLVGEWFDLKDRSGYFGTFQVRVVDSDNMKGLWMGHSKDTHLIRTGSSIWTKIIN
jgi:hypothetical protein